MFFFNKSTFCLRRLPAFRWSRRKRLNICSRLLWLAKTFDCPSMITVFSMSGMTSVSSTEVFPNFLSLQREVQSLATGPIVSWTFPCSLTKLPSIIFAGSCWLLSRSSTISSSSLSGLRPSTVGTGASFRMASFVVSSPSHSEKYLDTKVAWGGDRSSCLSFLAANGSNIA